MLHKVIHVLFLSVLFSGVVSASDSLKHYKATRIFEPIKIDGQLTESVWASTNALSDFVMNRPIEGGVPTQKTEVRIVYDNTAIYIGAMLYDSAPDSIL
ncbi:MAG TPA: hydrolase, partial [Bacteroidia bacterium]|nr:hydrolase [Bacteroidia bacterium]